MTLRTLNPLGSSFCSKHPVQHLLGERAWLATVLCQLKLLAGTHHRIFLKALEQRAFKFIKTCHILFRKESALRITHILLWHDTMVVVGPHKELHAHIRSHQYLAHIINLFSYFILCRDTACRVRVFILPVFGVIRVLGVLGVLRILRHSRGI